MVKELPLSTWKRTVRRVYLQPEKQLERLQAWYKEYIGNKNAFVDTTIEGKPRRLVRGGEEGLQKFELVLNSQLTLVRKGMLSGEYCLLIWLQKSKLRCRHYCISQLRVYVQGLTNNMCCVVTAAMCLVL